jgi:hypothetical protein
MQLPIQHAVGYPAGWGEQPATFPAGAFGFAGPEGGFHPVPQWLGYSPPTVIFPSPPPSILAEGTLAEGGGEGNKENESQKDKGSGKHEHRHDHIYSCRWMLWNTKQEFWDKHNQEYYYEVQKDPGDVSMLRHLGIEHLQKWAKVRGVKAAKEIKDREVLLKRVMDAIEGSAGNEILFKDYPDLAPMVAALQEGHLEFHTPIPPKPKQMPFLSCFKSAEELEKISAKIQKNLDKIKAYQAKEEKSKRMFLALGKAVGVNINCLNWIRVPAKSASEGDKIYVLEWVHREDWMHRKMQKKEMKPNPEKYLPDTIVDDLDYKLMLPCSMYTAVWLLPLTDGRVFIDWEKRAGDDSKQMQREVVQGKGKKSFWSTRNILNQTPFHFIFSLILPTILSFFFVIFLQVGFLYYISEVVLQDRSQWKCYGRQLVGGAGTRKATGASGDDDASNMVETWDSDNPKVLRYIGLLTFLSEIFRVRKPQFDFNPLATFMFDPIFLS